MLQEGNQRYFRLEDDDPKAVEKMVCFMYLQTYLGNLTMKVERERDTGLLFIQLPFRTDYLLASDFPPPQPLDFCPRFVKDFSRNGSVRFMRTSSGLNESGSADLTVEATTDFEVKNSDDLVLHAKMCVLGNKYQWKTLMDHAIRRFNFHLGMNASRLRGGGLTRLRHHPREKRTETCHGIRIGRGDP